METLTLILTILSFLLTLSLMGSLFFIIWYFKKNKETIATFIKKEFRVGNSQRNLNQILSEIEGEPKEILTKLIEGKIANTQEEISTLSQLLFKSDPDVHEHFPGMSPTNYSGIGLEPESITELEKNQEALREQHLSYIRKIKSNKEQVKATMITKPWVYSPPGTPFVSK